MSNYALTTAPRITIIDRENDLNVIAFERNVENKAEESRTRNTGLNFLCWERS